MRHSYAKFRHSYAQPRHSYAKFRHTYANFRHSYARPHHSNANFRHLYAIVVVVSSSSSVAVQFLLSLLVTSNLDLFVRTMTTALHVGACCDYPNTIIYTGVGRDFVEVYEWQRYWPLGGLVWPFDSMTRRPGYLPLDYNGLHCHLLASGRPYWVGRVFKGNGGLDLHIQFQGGTRVYHLRLEYPGPLIDSGAADDCYPRPRDWYMAMRARYRGLSWVAAEYYDTFPDLQPVTSASSAMAADPLWAPGEEEDGSNAIMLYQTGVTDERDVSDGLR